MPKQALKSLIVPTLLSILTIGGFSTLLYYIDNKNRALNTLTSELQFEQKRELQQKLTKKILADTEDKRAKLNSFIINDKDGVVEFIETIESLATRTNANLTVNSVSTEEGGTGKFEYVKLSGTGTGSLSNIYWFLKLIEVVKEKSDITQLYLEELGGGDSEVKRKNSWRLSFTIQALKFK